ncbi:MAG: glycoside hydrolase family 3 N-terminal domain-containing protein [Desulfosalsimonadaceae bacterium]
MQAESLTTAQLAGQRLMAGFLGAEANQDLRYLIRTLKVGGVILFSRNIGTPSRLRSLCSFIQEYASSCGQPPLFIAVDQEGGVVSRLSPPYTQFPGNPFIRTETEAREFGDITGNELSRTGINMNMAPVLDVAPPGFASIMAERMFGRDPAHVAQMGALVIRHLQNQGIMAVAKHFPGIGRTTLDSHHELPDLDASLQKLEAFDLRPFLAAIRNGAAAVMLSHIRYPRIDPHWPASLSAEICGNLLRRKIGYSGLVLTDDLDMGAISRHYDIGTIVSRLFAATIDIALICHSASAIEAAAAKMQRLIESESTLRAEALCSANRIAKLKNAYIRQPAY